jgi:hypothetical protein
MSKVDGVPAAVRAGEAMLAAGFSDAEADQVL